MSIYVLTDTPSVGHNVVLFKQHESNCLKHQYQNYENFDFIFQAGLCDTIDD